MTVLENTSTPLALVTWLLAVLAPLATITAADSARADVELGLANDVYQISTADDGDLVVRKGDLPSMRFKPEFTVLYTASDPKPELRWSDLGDSNKNVRYNVLTWRTYATSRIKAGEWNAPDHLADGFDVISDQTLGRDRTSDLFRAGHVARVRLDRPERCNGRNGRVEWKAVETPDFLLGAIVVLDGGTAEPRMEVQFVPRKSGWFSVGYTGAPSVDVEHMDEAWQPLIWQEKRFPNQSYLSESGRCPLPATLVTKDGVTWAVTADPNEYPFRPLPTVANSRFGVAVRNPSGAVQPMIFAPILGGDGSRMSGDKPFLFSFRISIHAGGTVDAYEELARNLFGFRDLRHNALGSLNHTLERMIDYAFSEYGRFDEDLRGAAYETDVPGSVKNVSSLHPLGIALVTDDERVFDRRARPMIEYVLSREKFLFTTDPRITGQSASAKMTGPCAPVSELCALYDFSRGQSPALLNLAQDLGGVNRMLNLDDVVYGDSWQNALAMYRATGETTWLEKAKTGADEYIARRIQRPQTDFKDPDARGMNFWTSFAPNWMELYELYEATGERRYLKAAHNGARRFAQFVNLSPSVPEGTVTVNDSGQAPLYRRGKKWPPIDIPEETVPAWRISEIGLTCESSTTSKTHRGIFPATHAPGMLRLAQQTGDSFLHDIGRAAIIGRYASFPGYHMNTARTTVYEKANFAHRPTAQINSTSSLHYNHIWPHISLLLDYLVSDTYYRSNGQIVFPSQFAEGYAYFQGKVYGHETGVFYSDNRVSLWMPKGLLEFDHPEVNYIAGRGPNGLYLALMNQTAEPIVANLRLAPSLVTYMNEQSYKTRFWEENKLTKTEAIAPGKFQAKIAPRGITALAISGLNIEPKFQGKFQSTGPAWKKDYAELGSGKGRAIVLNFGPQLRWLYVYSQLGAETIRAAKLHFNVGDGWQTAADENFPYEFSLPLDASVSEVRLKLEVTTVEGNRQVSPPVTLHQ